MKTKESSIARLILFGIIMLIAGCSEKDGVIFEVDAVEQKLSGVLSSVPGLPQTRCQRVLIDASHDGGAWWYPQFENFNSELPHQGEKFLKAIRNAGFLVDVLSRSQQVTPEILSNYDIIFRMGGFESYTEAEVSAYATSLDNGVTLLLFSDHQKFSDHDEVAGLLGLRFEGVLEGQLNVVKNEAITENIDGIDYMVGSHIVPADSVSMTVLASVNRKPVMAFVPHAKARIFVMGDVNAIEFIAQPFANNLVNWMIEPCISL